MPGCRFVYISKAVKAIMDIYASPVTLVATKTDNSPLTQVDLASNHVIVTSLADSCWDGLYFSRSQNKQIMMYDKLGRASGLLFGRMIPRNLSSVTENLPSTRRLSKINTPYWVLCTHLHWACVGEYRGRGC